MWDHIPDPLPLHNDLECPYCHQRFKFTENDNVNKGLTCPHCGEVSKFLDCISPEAVQHELMIARKKMENALFKSQKQKSSSWLFRSRKNKP